MSVVALLIALASFAYVRRQALASEQIAATDRGRSHKERTPAWKPTLEQADHGDWYTLSLRLAESPPLDSVVVNIFDSPGISFLTSQKGVDPSHASPVLTATHCALIEGEQAMWRLTLELERAPELHLRVQSTASSEPWETALHIDVPGDPSQSVW